MAATAEPTGKQKNKPRSEKKPQATQSPAHDKLKTIVRRLPPNLPEDVFWQSVQPWVTDETVSWRAFYPGKIRKKHNVNKEDMPSRAYIAFRTVEKLATFSQAYDGHIFRDKTGNESFAIVEFAPFQKVPPEKRKVDTRMGTIEQDDDFKSFLASLSTPTSKPSETETIEALVAASQPPEQPKTTPLLEALRAEKQAQRDKETILKAHAHYRDRNLAKEELGSRKKGKQVQGAPPAERDEASAGPGQGKRNRRGGKKGDANAGGPAQKAKAKEAAIAPPTKVLVKTAVKQGSQQDSASSAPSTKEAAKEPPQERRARPGIGTRQFEVALAGAGVLPGGSDRKSRRERERERKLGAPAESVATADKGKDKVEKPSAQTSPGKERSRGGRKRGDSAKSQTGPTITNVVESFAGPVPTILPRGENQPGILSRPVPALTAKDVPISEGVPGEPESRAATGGRTTPGEGRGEGHGGRRRGRGRSFPRGAAPPPAVRDPMR
ncbi:hypothetical protein ACEPAF_2730 [Sanghuangporus sanghuang]